MTGSRQDRVYAWGERRPEPVGPATNRFGASGTRPRDAELPPLELEGREGADEWLRGGRRGFVLRRLLAASDLVALLGAYGAMLAIISLLGRDPLGANDFWLVVTLLPLWLALGTPLRLYHVGERGLDYSVADEVGPVFMVATVWGWALLMARAAIDPGIRLEVLPSFLLWAMSIALVLSLRVAVVSVSRRLPWYRQRVLLVGSGADAARVSRRVTRHPEWGIDVVGSVDLALTDGDNGSPSVRDVIATAEELAADRVLIASPPIDLAARSELIRDLIDSRIQVDLVSGDPDLCSSSAASLNYLEGLPVLTVPSVQVPRTWKSLKRVIDVALAGLGLAVVSPLLLFCAIAIKLESPGPVFFRQRRVGRHGREFELLKLRTMVADAEELKSDVADRNMHNGSAQLARMFKIPDDPRITRFGAFMRRWSIDELPQLWNVLKGEMSMIGPRPLIPVEAALVGGRYAVRLEMRPGITGPWQTLGRSDIGFEDMVKLDYTYVMNWTLAEDFKLLIRTAGAVLQAKGAY
jgi:exopolysaccharide biosynthesis polyprenyl glycosylphosphotransferase